MMKKQDTLLALMCGIVVGGSMLTLVSAQEEQRTMVVEQIVKENNAFLHGSPDYDGSETFVGRQNEPSLLQTVTILLMQLTILVSVTMIIIASIKLVMAQGDSNARSKSSTQIGYIILGIIIGLASFAVLRFAETAVNTADAIIDISSS